MNLLLQQLVNGLFIGSVYGLFAVAIYAGFRGA